MSGLIRIDQVLPNYIQRTEFKDDTKTEYDEIVETILKDKVTYGAVNIDTDFYRQEAAANAYCFPFGQASENCEECRRVMGKKSNRISTPIVRGER